jgi:hypothetical protein
MKGRPELIEPLIGDAHCEFVIDHLGEPGTCQRCGDLPLRSETEISLRVGGIRVEGEDGRQKRLSSSVRPRIGAAGRPALLRRRRLSLRTAFASLRVTCSVFETFLLLTFGHLSYFAAVAFARVAPLPLVAL